MKFSQPTPNIGIKRLLSNSFDIAMVDEYKTSKLCHDCKSENKNLIKRPDPRPWKTGNMKTVHSLLCCTNINCNRFWNRDVNGSLNILEIGKSILFTGDKPLCFKRPNSIKITP